MRARASEFFRVGVNWHTDSGTRQDFDTMGAEEIERLFYGE
jgi:hypothetical protein